MTHGVTTFMLLLSKGCHSENLISKISNQISTLVTA